MARAKEADRSLFFCNDCGHESPKWLGFCPSPLCGSQTPLVEIGKGRNRPGAARKPSQWTTQESSPALELSQVDGNSRPALQLPGREINRVLGGGIVPGSVLLLTGEPGVGKSTLLLQIAGSSASQGLEVLYVSGEESPQQVKLRSDRLGISGQGIYILPESELDTVMERLDESPPGLVIVDSIQTLYASGAQSGPGSVSQVRECGLQLMQWAKRTQVPVLLSGHVTKEGSVAGPRVLEHIVDVVTYLEAQDSGVYRLLRNSKNRFGSTAEVGVFEMTGHGLAEVSDPSKALLSQGYGPSIGAAVAPVLEGSRPWLLEVQALTSQSQIPVPRRVTNGLDYSRVLMLVAVAGRRGGLELSGQDVILSVAGGFRISEPAADLPALLAIGSSLSNQPLEPGLAAFGEVGLGGELRPVPQAQRRIQELARLGFNRCILPMAEREDVKSIQGVRLEFVKSLREALTAALGPPRARNPGASTGVV